MRRYYKNGKLVGGQTKIASAAKPFDKITGEDFKALKRKKAMGGGMMRKTYDKGGRVKAADGLWANIHAKRKRIKSGSGEKMRSPGSEGAPTAKALKDSQT